MPLVCREHPDGRGVFLVRKDGTEVRVAFVPPTVSPTAEQMIRIETAWFTSAGYPNPISETHYLRAIGPHARRTVPRQVTNLPPDLAAAATPTPRPWDAEP